MDKLRVPASQMDDEPGQTAESAPTTEQVTTVFSDEAVNDVVRTEAPTFDSTYDTTESSVSDIKEFFSRPRKIADLSWATGDDLHSRLYPWLLYLQHPIVAKKLDNFALFRGTLHVKIMINGSPYRYGRALACYNPYTVNDQVTPYDVGSYSAIENIHYSQKPHVFLNPTTSTGGELTCPFVWPQNYFDLTFINEQANDLGEIIFSSLTTLQDTANSTSESYISVWAWVENVTVTMPSSQTTGLVTSESLGGDALFSVPTSQMAKSNKKNNTSNASRAAPPTTKDEWQVANGIISKPASALANIASRLTNVPVIGPYALATKMASDTVAGIATLFGYSRINILEKLGRYVALPQGEQATIDTPVPCVKLSFDSKQEVTIDPRTVGIECDDQMGIVDFASRESYITSFTWAQGTGALQDTLLYSIDVGPLFDIDTSGTVIYHTPASYLAQMFKYWRGTMKFRFQICGNAFHRGKLAIVYEPYQFGSTPQYNTQFTRMIEISEQPDVELEVGWGQRQPFLNTADFSSLPSVPFRAGAGARDTSSTWNGKIGVYVVNPLQGQTYSASESITVNVFASFCDDFRVSVPKSIGNNLQYIEPNDTLVIDGTIDGFDYAFVDNDFTRSLPGGDFPGKVCALYQTGTTTRLTLTTFEAIANHNRSWYYAITDPDTSLAYFFPRNGRQEDGSAWPGFRLLDLTIAGTTYGSCAVWTYSGDVVLPTSISDWNMYIDATSASYLVALTNGGEVTAANKTSMDNILTTGYTAEFETTYVSGSLTAVGEVNVSIWSLFVNEDEDLVAIAPNYETSTNYATQNDLAQSWDQEFYPFGGTFHRPRHRSLPSRPLADYYPGRPSLFSVPESQMDMGSISSSLGQDTPVGAIMLEPINPGQAHNELHSVYFGEALSSLRQLFARYCRHRVVPKQTLGGGNPWLYPSTHLPMNPGENANGYAVDSTTSTTLVWPAAMTPLSWLTPCYAAWRGGMRHKYALQGSASGSQALVSVTRGDYVIPDTTPVQTVSYGAWNQMEPVASGWEGVPGLGPEPDTWQGSQMTNMATNQFLDVELPWYRNARFLPARFLNQVYDPHYLYVESYASNVVTLDHYISAGIDFSLFFFTGIPPIKYGAMNTF